MGLDRGYCLGSAAGPGRCLGCGACLDEGQRQAILHHRIPTPELGPYLGQLRALVSRKRALRPLYCRIRTGGALSGVFPEFLNALVFRQLLAAAPDLVENLLSVRESLFTVSPNHRQFPTLGGESVFALRAWDAEKLRETLAGLSNLGEGVEVLGPVEGFTPGVFTAAWLEVALPLAFAEGRAALERYLREAYVPFSLRREDDRYRLEVSPKGAKKRVLFGGWLAPGPEGFRAELQFGPKFNLQEWLAKGGIAVENAWLRVICLEV